MKIEMKTRKPVTHLSLSERHRRLAGLRSAQLGLSLTAYFSALVAQDAEQSGLVDALETLRKLDAAESAEVQS
jgi:hypothetical protein